MPETLSQQVVVKPGAAMPETLSQQAVVIPGPAMPEALPQQAMVIPGAAMMATRACWKRWAVQAEVMVAQRAWGKAVLTEMVK